MADTRLIRDFAELLSKKGFEIANSEFVSQEPPSEYKFAKQIFNNKIVLLPFLLKAALTIKDTDSRFSVRPTWSEDYGKLQTFLDTLKEDGFVLNWTKEGNEYDVELSQDGDKMKFFRSDWAEMCFRYIIMKVVQQFCQTMTPALSYKAFQNVEIKTCERLITELGLVVQKAFPNVEIKSNDKLFTELDLVVQIENQFYLFEVKSGPRINIMQWAKHEAFVDKQGYIKHIVCTVHDNIPENIFEPQILMTIASLEKRLLKLLETDFSASPPNHRTTALPNHQTT